MKYLVPNCIDSETQRRTQKDVTYLIPTGKMQAHLHVQRNIATPGKHKK